LVLDRELGPAGIGQGHGVVVAVLLDAPPNRLQVSDPLLDSPLGVLQCRIEMWSRRLPQPVELDHRQLLNLLDRQSRRAQMGNHPYAPQHALVDRRYFAPLRPAL